MFYSPYKNMEKCSLKNFVQKIKFSLLYQIFLIFFQPKFFHPVLQLLGGHGQLLRCGVEPLCLAEGFGNDTALIFRQQDF